MSNAKKPVVKVTKKQPFEYKGRTLDVKDNKLYVDGQELVFKPLMTRMNATGDINPRTLVLELINTGTWHHMVDSAIMSALDTLAGYWLLKPSNADATAAAIIRSHGNLMTDFYDQIGVNLTRYLYKYVKLDTIKQNLAIRMLLCANTRDRDADDYEDDVNMLSGDWNKYVRCYAEYATLLRLCKRPVPNDMYDVTRTVASDYIGILSLSGSNHSRYIGTVIRLHEVLDEFIAKDKEQTDNVHAADDQIIKVHANKEQADKIQTDEQAEVHVDETEAVLVASEIVEVDA